MHGPLVSAKHNRPVTKNIAYTTLDRASSMTHIAPDSYIAALCWTFFPSPVGPGYWGRHIGEAFHTIHSHPESAFMLDYTKDSRLHYFHTPFKTLEEAMRFAEQVTLPI